MKRLGAILEKARGKDSRVQFARKLGLSYTFVRAMEHGLRFPSDKVLLDIAEKLGEDPEELFLAAYCDRSSHLAEVLRGRGIPIPEGVDDEPEVKPASSSSQEPDSKTSQPGTSEGAGAAARSMGGHDPF